MNNWIVERVIDVLIEDYIEHRCSLPYEEKPDAEESVQQSEVEGTK